MCSEAVNSKYAESHYFGTLKSPKKHNIVSQLMEPASSETNICEICVLSLPKVTELRNPSHGKTRHDLIFITPDNRQAPKSKANK